MNAQFTKEALDAVNAVFTSIAAKIIKQFPTWDFATVNKQVGSLQQVLSGMTDGLGSQHCVFELTQEDDVGKPALTAAKTHRINEQSISIIKIGKGCNIVSAHPFTADTPTSVELSERSASTVLVHREANNAATVYAKGLTIGFFDITSPHRRPPSSSKYARRAEDYEISVLDHYKKNVRYWQSTDHWQDRPRRILLATKGKSKTEDIFHQDLHLWLDRNLQAQVIRGAKDTTRDALDLLIIAPNGRTFLIEVKWMGKNSNDTKYTIKDVSKDIGQLKDYLLKRPDIRRGTLVAYDGREAKEFESLACISNEQVEGCKRLDTCCGVRVPERGNCLILFLENTTASQQP